MDLWLLVCWSSDACDTRVVPVKRFPDIVEGEEDGVNRAETTVTD